MRTLSRFIVLFGLAACAAAPVKPEQSLVERLGEGGVYPKERAVESGTALRFVNDDAREHEIYSNDCRELGSEPLAPGQVFIARLYLGPKDCHFQDLLAPTAPEYWGTVHVEGPSAPIEPGF